MKQVSEKSLQVLNLLKENQDENYTAADIADILGMTVRGVNGVVTSGLQKRGLTVRIPAEIELDDGTHKGVKIIKLTEEGLNYDHDAAVAEDEAEAAAKKAEKEAKRAEREAAAATE